MLDRPTHVIIPDSQVRPGVDTLYLDWIGRYIVEHFAGHPLLKIIHLGDFWDFPSLSSYDKGKKAMEGRRVAEDIEAGNEAFLLLNNALLVYNEGRRKRDQWWPERHLLRGNHENRLTRAIDDNAQLDGVLSLDSLDSLGWEVHDFLVPVELDGVLFSHYFYNGANGRPFSGMIETRLKQVGRSFVQGHQQTLMYGVRPIIGGMHHGLVAGACYLHDEDYLGPQGNAPWRGIVVAHEVAAGSYSPMFVSLDYLCRRFEGVDLATYLSDSAS